MIGRKPAAIRTCLVVVAFLLWAAAAGAQQPEPLVINGSMLQLPPEVLEQLAEQTGGSAPSNDRESLTGTRSGQRQDIRAGMRVRPPASTAAGQDVPLVEPLAAGPGSRAAPATDAASGTPVDAPRAGMPHGANAPRPAGTNQSPSALRSSDIQPPWDTQPSPTEALFRERYNSKLSARLSQFGYDLFGSLQQVPPRATPEPRYVLGPGDMAIARISGTGLDRRISVAVGPDGSVDLPGMGVAQVAGLTLEQAQTAIQDLARQYYNGVEVTLSMDRLRDVQVYVVGDVRRPGLLHLPAFSTALGALAQAGGVKKTGSLRRIRLVRDGRGAAEIDLYGLLLYGDRKADQPLRDKDVLFVPRLGPTAGVAGAVRAPGIYELVGEKTASQLLSLAGGALPQALSGRVHLRRFEAGGSFAIQDLSATDANGLSRMQALGGDLLEVRFAEADLPAAVRLTGHVRTTDAYRWRPGLSLRDVLRSPEVLKPEAITDFALLRRYDEASSRHRLTTFPLAKVLDGSYNMELRPFDEVEILSRQAYGIREPLVLRGAVWREGEYDHTPGMTVNDLLALGGGLKFGADPARIELTRKELTGDEAHTRYIPVNLNADRSIPLQPYDAVFVPGRKDADTFRSVTLSGEVRYPGTYRIEAGETLSMVLRRAGGFTSEAYLYGTNYSSRKAQEIQQQSIDRLVRELEMWADRTMVTQSQDTLDKEEAGAAKEARASIGRLLASVRQVKAAGRVGIVLTDVDSFAGSPYDFLLEDGDALDVPRKPSFVSVVGSVYTPSSFLYRAQADVSDYLAQSGGPTREADERHMYVLKANGEVVSMAQASMSRHRFRNQTLMPGDTLVVPEDFERVPYFRLVRGMSDVLFKIATTAGIVLAVL